MPMDITRGLVSSDRLIVDHWNGVWFDHVTIVIDDFGDLDDEVKKEEKQDTNDGTRATVEQSGHSNPKSVWYHDRTKAEINFGQL